MGWDWVGKERGREGFGGMGLGRKGQGQGGIRWDGIGSEGTGRATRHLGLAAGFFDTPMPRNAVPLREGSRYGGWGWGTIFVGAAYQQGVR